MGATVTPKLQALALEQRRPARPSQDLPHAQLGSPSLTLYGAAVKGRGQVFKVIMKYPDGTREEDDEVFESESEATEYGLNQLNNYETGGEVLHLSNPGDYPLSDDDTADFEVIEV